MPKIRFKTDIAGFYDVRRMPKLIDLLESHGKSIMDGANDTLPEGEGYRMSSGQGRKKPQGRWAVRVYTASNHAKASNARRNTLVSLLSSRQDR